MIGTIHANAKRLRELNSRINETVERRDNSEKELNEWKQACEQFHAEYDKLAFPGGLELGIKRIKEGHMPTIQAGLIYLENTPYCFRSQYVAKDIKRALNKVELPSQLAERFTTYKQSKIRNRAG